MVDIEGLRGQVKLNCTISDARFWGYFSICGLLLRMRELYRSEKSLMPWEVIPREEMGEWIAAREAEWKALETEPLRPLKIEGNVYDPFEVDRLNVHLNAHGLLYAGGYGRFNKPSFFLGKLEGRGERGDYLLHSSGQELCRDLSTSVAMLQGRCIFMRREPLKLLLWDKFQELRARKSGGLLKEAFSALGSADALVPEELYQRIDSLSLEIAEIFILHETGEAYEDEYSDEWLDILDQNRDRATDFYVRGVKDLLADTSEKGPLKYIIGRKESTPLNFYMLFLDGIRKEIFPEIMNAFQKFADSADWVLLEEARRTGYARARTLRERIVRLWREGKGEKIGALIREYVKTCCVRHEGLK